MSWVLHAASCSCVRAQGDKALFPCVCSPYLCSLLEGGFQYGEITPKYTACKASTLVEIYISGASTPRAHPMPHFILQGVCVEIGWKQSGHSFQAIHGHLSDVRNNVLTLQVPFDFRPFRSHHNLQPPKDFSLSACPLCLPSAVVTLSSRLIYTLSLTSTHVKSHTFTNTSWCLLFCGVSTAPRGVL